MKKQAIMLTSMVLLGSLTIGCTNGYQVRNRDVGAVVGAVGGGALGSAVSGGSTAATIAGTIGGGFVGYQVGKSTEKRRHRSN